MFCQSRLRRKFRGARQHCRGDEDRTLHYTTLHDTTLHYTALKYNTIQYTILHYTTLHYTTLHYTTLHYTTPEQSFPHFAGDGDKKLTKGRIILIDWRPQLYHFRTGNIPEVWKYKMHSPFPPILFAGIYPASQSNPKHLDFTDIFFFPLIQQK